MNNLKTIITIGFIVISINAIAQLKYFPVLIGLNKKQVTALLDSTFKLKVNQIDSSGRKDYPDSNYYSVYFNNENEEYYTCLDTFGWFDKINGKNVCTRQMIIMSQHIADYNLDYIKNNYTYVSDNKWIHPFNTQYNIQAVYDTVYRRIFKSISYSLIKK